MFSVGALEKPPALQQRQRIEAIQHEERRLFACGGGVLVDLGLLVEPVAGRGCNHPQQSDNLAPSMMIAVMVLAEAAGENNYGYGYLYEDA
jgi:hypothetical protein